MNATNPFQPYMGAEPPLFIGRDKELSDFANALSGNPRNYCVTGLSGVGKTTLLHHYAALARDHGSFVVELVIGKRLCDERAFLAMFLDALPSDTGQQRLLPALLAAGGEAREKGAPIVFLFDDFNALYDTPREHQFMLSSLIDAFTEAQLQGMPVILGVAGLPQITTNFRATKKDVVGLFHQQRLRSLGEGDARKAFTEPLDTSGIKYEPAVVDAVYAATQGYPYFLQHYGKALWDLSVESGNISLAFYERTEHYIRQDLAQDFYQPQLERAAPRELRTLNGAAQLGGESFTVHDLVSANTGEEVGAKDKRYKATHRSVARLAEGGLLYQRQGWGEYGYTLPLFGDFLREQTP